MTETDKTIARLKALVDASYDVVFPATSELDDRYGLPARIRTVVNERDALKAESDALKAVAIRDRAVIEHDTKELASRKGRIEVLEDERRVAMAERDAFYKELQQAREEKDRAIDDVVAKSLLKSPAYLKLEAERDAALAELAEARKELETERRLSAAIKRADQATSPCGHNQQYLWSPDGVGKTILCLACLYPKSQAQLSAANDQVQSLRRALEESGAELSAVEHKFERAGGIWKVAERGVELGAPSWASNVENALHNLRVILDAALASAPASTSVRSDSERLDWLEKEGNPVVLTSPDMSNKNWLLRAPGCKGRYLTLRAAIDAAMSQRTGE